MELKEFVTQTLVQIIVGVRGAQAVAKQHEGEVSPTLTNRGDSKADKTWSYSGKQVHEVKFDVALTVSEGAGTKGGISVFASAVNLGSLGQSLSQNTTVSRVQFSVPLVLPTEKPT